MTNWTVVILCLLGFTQWLSVLHAHILNKRAAVGKPVLTASTEKIRYDTPLTVTCEYDKELPLSITLYTKDKKKKVPIASVSGSDPPILSIDQSEATVSSSSTSDSAQLSVSWPYNAFDKTDRVYCTVEIEGSRQPKEQAIKISYEKRKGNVVKKPVIKANPSKVEKGTESSYEVNCQIDVSDLAVFESGTFSVCPVGWTALDQCYFPGENMVTFEEAKAACEEKGGYVARPKTDEQASNLKQFFSSQWIGLTENSEGVWEWQDGDVVTFNLWKNGEPKSNTAAGKSKRQTAEGTEVEEGGPQTPNENGKKNGRKFIELISALLTYPFSFFGFPFFGGQQQFTFNDQSGVSTYGGFVSTLASKEKKCTVTVGNSWMTKDCEAWSRYVCVREPLGTTDQRSVAPAVSDVTLQKLSISVRDPQDKSVLYPLATVRGNDVMTVVRGDNLPAAATATYEFSEDKTALNLKLTFTDVVQTEDQFYTCDVVADVAGAKKPVKMSRSVMVKVR